MFGRLLKHELKSTWKQFVSLFGAAIIAGLFLGLAIRTLEPFLIMLMSLIFSGALFALIGLSLTYMARMLYQNIYSKQGYLTFSLPVSIHKIFLSKFLACLIYVMGISLSLILSVCLMFLVISPETVAEIGGNLLLGYFQRPVLILLQLIWSIIGFFAFVISIQFIFSLSNSGIFKGNRKVVSTLLFIGYYVVIGMLEVYNPINLYITYNATDNVLSFVTSISDAFLSDIYFSLGSLIFNIILIVGLYFATIAIVEKKIELE